MYKRKTIDTYEVQGYYDSQYEMVTTEETWKDAKEQLKCYRENEPGISFRIVKKRERIAD